tara:strand:+ start:15768 stop:16205 length:438 start_codon:yes stop_codon:yes gene_type:complete
MASYPEIEALNKIYVNHQVEIEFSTTDFLTKNKEYCAVAFTIEKETFYFYVEDEYGDIKYNYPLLNLCLVLRELEFYAESSDYLVWCQDRYFDPENNSILAHFKNLKTVYQSVEKIIGKIESYISNWDFEMGSGASWELRKKGLT